MLLSFIAFAKVASMVDCKCLVYGSKTHTSVMFLVDHMCMKHLCIE